MGAQLQGAGRSTGGGRRRPRRGAGPLSEINVTPFVDVMLVLLIVFMVTAPLLTVGVKIDLPETRAPAMAEGREPLAVSVAADGRIFLQDTEVAFEELVPRLIAIAENGYEERVFVRGDGQVAYARVAEVMGALAASGFRKVGLVTDPKAALKAAEEAERARAAQTPAQ